MNNVNHNITVSDITRCKVQKNNSSFRLSIEKEFAEETGIEVGDTVIIAVLEVRKVKKEG